MTLQLDEFGREALGRYVGRRGSEAAAVRTAALYYLADRDSGRAAWPAQAALGPGQSLETRVLNLDAETWGQIEVEADRQGVPPNELVVHAILYFLADIDSGRMAARLQRALRQAE